MAQQNVIVRLSLKDQDVVRRGLEQLGADGEKALRRIEAASRQPSAGLKALGAASDELRGSMGALSGRVGIVGTGLSALGPAGLAAAAGIGAVAIAILKAMDAARQSIDYFSRLNDAAERIGMNVEGFQAFSYAALQVGVDAEQSEKSLTKLNDAIGKVLQDGADTPKEVKQAFDALGVSMADVQKHGEDLDWMLAAMAEGFAGVKTQAERTTIAKALFGREGAKLLPLLEQGAAKLREYEQAARDAGAVLSGDLEKAYADLGDRLDAAAKKLEVQKGRILPEAAEATLRYAEAVAGAAETLANFLDDVRQDLGPSVFDDIVDAAVTVNLPGGPLMLLWNSIKGIVNGLRNLRQYGATGSWGGGATGSWGGATGEWERQSPLPRPTARLAIPLPRGSGRGGWPDSGKTSKGRKSGSGRRGPEYVDIVTGAPHTPTEDELYLLAHPAKPRPVGGLDEFQDAADQIEKRNNELMASLQRAWLQASDQRVALINFERDQQLKALEDVELSEEQLAVARLAINTTADKKIADESLSFTKSTDEATESAVNLKDTIHGFGQVATSAFEDAIIKGEKFSEVLNGLAEDIQRLVLRNTLNKLFDIAIDAGGRFASSLFSSTPSGPSTPGTPITAQPRTWDTAGWNAFLAEGNAYGNAFSGGNVIPFARGGVVHRPTLFPMARGMAPGHFVPGVMGEAGPEAVVPLRRMPSGNLGVEAGGKGVVVNVINNTPARVSTEGKRDGDGRMNINVVIDAVEQAMAQRMTRPGTSLNRALATAATPVRAR